MDDILDEPEDKTTTKYADRSFRCFLYCLAAFFIYAFIMFLSINRQLSIYISIIPMAFFFLVNLAFSVLGTVSGFKSIRYRERSWKKIVGITGNFLFLLFLVVFMIINVVGAITTILADGGLKS